MSRVFSLYASHHLDACDLAIFHHQVLIILYHLMQSRVDSGRSDCRALLESNRLVREGYSTFSYLKKWRFYALFRVFRAISTTSYRPDSETKTSDWTLASTEQMIPRVESLPINSSRSDRPLRWKTGRIEDRGLFHI